MDSAQRRAGGAILLLPLLAAALYGGNIFGLRERLFPTASRVSGTALSRAVAHALSGNGGFTSEPWWSPELPQVAGVGNRTLTLRIDSQALQWRVQWSCQSGEVSLGSAPSPGGAATSLGRSQCPGAGTGYGVDTGPVLLKVQATGPWTLRVDEQVNSPRVDPPLPAMSVPGSAVAFVGSFYGIDQQAQGSFRLYRLATGGYAVRVQDFYVTPNTDLEIRLSTAPRPRTTGDYLDSSSAFVAALPITAGSMNFMVPAGLDPHGYQSVVIWCERQASAYAGAPLGTP